MLHSMSEHRCHVWTGHVCIFLGKRCDGKAPVCACRASHKPMQRCWHCCTGPPAQGRRTSLGTFQAAAVSPFSGAPPHCLRASRGFRCEENLLELSLGGNLFDIKKIKKSSLETTEVIFKLIFFNNELSPVVVLPDAINAPQSYHPRAIYTPYI